MQAYDWSSYQVGYPSTVPVQAPMQCSPRRPVLSHSHTAPPFPQPVILNIVPPTTSHIPPPFPQAVVYDVPPQHSYAAQDTAHAASYAHHERGRPRYRSEQGPTEYYASAHNRRVSFAEPLQAVAAVQYGVPTQWHPPPTPVPAPLARPTSVYTIEYGPAPAAVQVVVPAHQHKPHQHWTTTQSHKRPRRTHKKRSHSPRRLANHEAPRPGHLHQGPIIFAGCGHPIKAARISRPPRR